MVKTLKKIMSEHKSYRWAVYSSHVGILNTNTPSVNYSVSGKVLDIDMATHANIVGDFTSLGDFFNAKIHKKCFKINKNNRDINCFYTKAHGRGFQ